WTSGGPNEPHQFILLTNFWSQVARAPARGWRDLKAVTQRKSKGNRHTGSGGGASACLTQDCVSRTGVVSWYSALRSYFSRFREAFDIHLAAAYAVSVEWNV